MTSKTKECSFLKTLGPTLCEGFVLDPKFSKPEWDKDELGDYCKINLLTDIIKPSVQSDPSYNLNAFLKPSRVFRHKR